MKNHLIALLSALAFVAMSLLTPINASAETLSPAEKAFRAQDQNGPNIDEKIVDDSSAREHMLSLQSNPASPGTDCPQCIRTLNDAGTVACKGLHEQQPCIRPTGPAAPPGSVVPVKKSGTVR